METPKATRSPFKWFVADSEVLDEPKKEELRKLLLDGRAPLNETQRLDFVDRVTESISEWIQTSNNESAASLISQIKKVNKAASALTKALGEVSQETFMKLRANRDDLVIVPNNNYPLPNRFLNPERRRVRLEHDLVEIQDQLEMLIQSSAYTNSKIKVSRQIKVEQRHAASLAYLIVSKYQLITATTPPYSKNTWFLPFLKKALSLAGGLEIGEEKLKEIIGALQDPPG